MKDLAKQLPEGSLDNPGPDDVYSQVMGVNNYGYANMYGLGVRASNVWGVKAARAAIDRENAMLKSENERLRSENERLKETDGTLVGITPPHSSVVPNVQNPLRVCFSIYRFVLFSHDKIEVS